MKVTEAICFCSFGESSVDKRIGTQLRKIIDQLEGLPSWQAAKEAPSLVRAAVRRVRTHLDYALDVLFNVHTGRLTVKILPSGTPIDDYSEEPWAQVPAVEESEPTPEKTETTKKKPSKRRSRSKKAKDDEKDSEEPEAKPKRVGRWKPRRSS